MIVKEIRFKNIKSYGNKQQSIIFDKPGLWLIHGMNGSGKSSIMDVLDVVLFNIARGKNNNRIPIKNIVNRINKNLEVFINFDNFKNDSIQIVRKVDPSDFNITINEQNYTERFKLMNDIDKENVIGFNYQTFRSFISLSMNDFLNFIDLKPEDKRNLLNRLFNLEIIDEYQSITKEIINQNKKEIDRLSTEIINIDSELKGYMSIIQNNTGKNKMSKEDLKKLGVDKKKKLDDINKEMIELNNKISDFQLKIQEHKNYINISNNENIKRKTELLEVKNKIKIYESGNCPYCNSGLNDDEHLQLLNELKINETDLSDKIIQNDKKITYFQDENKSINQQIKVLEDSKDLLDEQIIDIRSDLKSIKKEFDEYEGSNKKIIDDLKIKGSILLKEKKEKNNKIIELKNDINELTDLIKVLGDNGARKSIILSIIPPINFYLTKLLKFINFPYEVKLNDNFDAEIYDKGEIIHKETPSNGEIKMLNICIAISYIQMVRKMKNINILFMDEVFQSVHKDNINLLLNLLKNFANENKLHLLLVHHGLEEVDPSYFNKIISVQKDMFSDLKIN